MMDPFAVPGSASAARHQAGGRQTKGDRRREAILAALERLLREATIAELDVGSIATAAGVSRSGFYFYFESKYAALAGALARVWNEMAEVADALLAGGDEPPEEGFPATIEAVAALWRRHEPLMIAMVQASACDPGAEAAWSAWRERLIRATADRIEAERAAGRARPGPPAQALARSLLLMNEAALFDDRRRSAAPGDTAATLDALAAIWLAAVWGIEAPVPG